MVIAANMVSQYASSHASFVSNQIIVGVVHRRMSEMGGAKMKMASTNILHSAVLTDTHSISFIAHSRVVHDYVLFHGMRCIQAFVIALCHDHVLEHNQRMTITQMKRVIYDFCLFCLCSTCDCFVYRPCNSKTKKLGGGTLL